MILDFKIFDRQDKQATETDFDSEMELLKTAEEQTRVRCIEDTNANKLLILHPLLQIFLSLKFKTIRFQFWILLIMQTILVCTLTASGVVFLQFTSCTNVTPNGSCFTNRYFEPNNTTLCSDDNEANMLEGKGYFVEKTNLKCEKSIIITNDNDKTLALKQICEAYGSPIRECWTYNGLVIWTIFILVCHFLKECWEFVSKENKFSYIISLENFLELIILVCGVAFVVVSHFDIEMANHFSAWMIFLVWCDLILYTGRFHTIGKYVFMSLHVIQILILGLFAYLPIFLAFTFGYYIMLQSNDNFNGYIRGFASVLAMMIDEISYNQFDYKYVNEHGGLNGSTQALTIIFMIFVSLILMNLLIAITVTNIEMLKKEGFVQISHRKVEELLEVNQYRKWKIYEWTSKLIQYFKIDFLENIKESIVTNIKKENMGYKLVCLTLLVVVNQNRKF